MSVEYQRLGPAHIQRVRELNALFGRAFHDREAYAARPPSDTYLAALLSRPDLVAIVATEGGAVVGGIVAYVLRKLEQERSEVYLYDLAVEEGHRRRGIATRLIGELRGVAAEAGAWVVFVQADTAPEDVPAVRLYEALGTREEVLHFDIPVTTASADADVT